MSVVINPSTVYLQRWNSNRIHSPTPTNAQQGTKVMTRLLIANNQDHMTRTNQWGQDDDLGQPIKTWHREQGIKGKGSTTQTGAKIKDTEPKTHITWSHFFKTLLTVLRTIFHLDTEVNFTFKQHENYLNINVSNQVILIKHQQRFSPTLYHS